MEFLKDIGEIKYEGKDSKNPLAFKHYNPDEMIEGKKMKDHLRFSVAYWHTWRGRGVDCFGEGTIKRKWDKEDNTVENAIQRVKVHFAFCKKLGIPYYCFHDRDVAPEGSSLKETNENLDKVVAVMKTLQKESGVKLLWCTANLFSNKRYMNGAGTNPELKTFAYACAQVKKCMEVAKELGAENYLFWGGREGYSTLLNTNLKRELDHYAAFLKMAVKYKKKIGFKGGLFIEPKPREPTSHQYDFDSSTVIGFLKTYSLDKDFSLNIECNHATLAQRSFHHEVTLASKFGYLGSIDANEGNPQCGWDVDLFSSNVTTTTKIMKVILEQGGLKGGLNFDAKLRRESVDLEDLFIAHIMAMDVWAAGLKKAAQIRKDGILDGMLKKRYESFDSVLGKKVEEGETDLQEMEKFIFNNETKMKNVSGKEEKFQSIFNSYMF